MSEQRKLTLICPDCGTEIVVDAVTGAILFHKPAVREREVERDFDALLAGLGESKARAEEIFQQEVTAHQDRDRLLEEKFKEALRRAEEDPDDEPPLRPWDLD